MKPGVEGPRGRSGCSVCQAEQAPACCGGLFPCFVLKLWHRRTVNCSYTHSYRVAIVFCHNTRFRFQR